MKKLHLTLSLAIFSFAVVTAVASSAVIPPEYYLANEQQPNSPCHQLPFESGCIIGAGTPCRIVIPGVGLRQIYDEIVNNTTCAVPMSFASAY